MTVKYVYYLPVSESLKSDHSRVKDMLDKFKSSFLTDFGDTVIVVPSFTNREGIESLPLTSN